MALLFADGFDHYGTPGNMTVAGYSEMSASFVGGSTARTGTAIYMGGASAWRRPLVTPSKNVGIGIAFRVAGALPSSDSNRANVLQINGPGNANIVNISVDVAGALVARVGDRTGPILATSAQGIVSPDVWYYFEAFLELAEQGHSNGTFIMRLNGSTIAAALNVAAGAGSTINIYGVNRVNFANNPFNSPDVLFDDMVIWDKSGALNNDFLGDRRCITSMPSEDGPAQGWVFEGAPSAWEAINEVPADVADFIEALNPGDISEFGFAPIDLVATSVAGVVIAGMAAKTDGSTSTMRLGVNSVGFVRNGEEIPVSQNFTYYNAVIERDPDGNKPWSKTSLDNMTARITREA